MGILDMETVGLIKHTRQSSRCHAIFPKYLLSSLKNMSTLVLFKLLPVKLLLVTDILPRLSRHL